MTPTEWNQLHTLLTKYIAELKNQDATIYPPKQWRTLFTELNCVVARSIFRALKIDPKAMDR